MFIIESLDADTMVRRLSPVALSADGYTDLLNGPMDHGWCHGYTCQERLSTFFSVVATGFNYTLYFTGPCVELVSLVRHCFQISSSKRFLWLMFRYIYLVERSKSPHQPVVIQEFQMLAIGSLYQTGCSVVDCYFLASDCIFVTLDAYYS